MKSKTSFFNILEARSNNIFCSKYYIDWILFLMLKLFLYLLGKIKQKENISLVHWYSKTEIDRFPLDLAKKLQICSRMILTYVNNELKL